MQKQDFTGKNRRSEEKPLEYSQWWWCDRWAGTADQLVEAGVVEKHMLPGQPGRNKSSVTFGKKGNGYGPDYVQIQRRGRYLFTVRKGISEEEEQLRKERRDKERELERKVSNLNEISEKGPDGIRKILKEYLLTGLSCVFADKGGIQFEGAKAVVLKEQMARMYHLLDTVQITQDKKIADRQIRECYVEAGLPVPEEYQPKLRVVR